MTNPFAPKRTRVAYAPARTSHLPTERLEQLGAPPMVVAEARRRWQAMGEQDRRDSLTMLQATSDDELQAQLPAMEAQVVAASVIGSSQVSDELVEACLSHIGEKASGTVREIETWVGDDRGRALATLVVELRRLHPDRRKTLVESLEAVIRAG